MLPSDLLPCRYGDLDYVLRALAAAWGAAVLPHLLVAVTYCDPGRKAKSYRCSMLHTCYLIPDTLHLPGPSEASVLTELSGRWRAGWRPCSDQVEVYFLV